MVEILLIIERVNFSEFIKTPHCEPEICTKLKNKVDPFHSVLFLILTFIQVTLHMNDYVFNKNP